MKPNHVWVIEIRMGTKWTPYINSILYYDRKAANAELEYWRSTDPAYFRVTKYVAAGGENG